MQKQWKCLSKSRTKLEGTICLKTNTKLYSLVYTFNAYKKPELIRFCVFLRFFTSLYVPAQIYFTFFDINAALSFAPLSSCSDLISEKRSRQNNKSKKKKKEKKENA